MEEGGSKPRSGVREKKRRKDSKNRKRKKRGCKTATAVDAQPVASRDHVVPDTTSAAAAQDLQENTAAVESRVDRVQSSGKKRPRQGNGGEKGVVKVSQLQHPFPTDYCDHFETPLQAYRDVEGALATLAKRLGKKRHHLRIWDPYYCAGRTPRLLARLGFPRVEHHNEDFYKVIQNNQQPPHDVLVTNPPYSGDHKKRCLEYCRASGKPWFLLIPNYVATKDYYKLSVLGSAAGPGGEPFYVVPDTKYPFDHPEGTGHADSPFFAVWFVHCASHNEEVFQAMKADKRGGVGVARSLDELARRGAVRTERRLNPRQRKAMKKRRKIAGATAGVGSNGAGHV